MPSRPASRSCFDAAPSAVDLFAGAHLPVEEHALVPDACAQCGSTALDAADELVEENLHVVKEHSAAASSDARPAGAGRVARGRRRAVTDQRRRDDHGDGIWAADDLGALTEVLRCRAQRGGRAALRRDPSATPG